jgi:hypothetical protein
MKRRDLVFVLGGLITPAHALRAQQKPMPVIGYLNNGLPAPCRERPHKMLTFCRGTKFSSILSHANLLQHYVAAPITG